MKTIVLVEDNPDLADGLISNLELEGYRVIHITQGDAAIPEIRRQSPDLIILDMMLPVMDGFEILSSLRRDDEQTPVLCLTARGAEVDKVRALRSGADDYVTKPFGLMELLARVEALLRRTVQTDHSCILINDLTIDTARREVSLGDSAVMLSPKEFDLLLALAKQPNQVLSRQYLMKTVWGHGSEIISRTVDTHIAELRKKLEENPAQPQLIVTARKAGYRLVSTEDSLLE